MTSKDRYFQTVSKSRRSSPGETQGNHGFFQTGQGLFPIPNVPNPNSQRATSPCTVPATYSNAYTQPRSAPNKLGYDINSPAFFGQYPTTGSSPQFPPAFTNYEIHERYSPQPSYPTYPSRSTPPPGNPADSRRLPPLSTSPAPTGERWQQNSYTQQTAAYPAANIRSPTASYPNQYMPYSMGNTANAYSYHMPQDHISMNPQHAVFNDLTRIDHPRSSSPYNRSSVSHISPPQSQTPPPISPTSPEEPTIKKKRKRADATQLKVLNETYARTAFPSTEERIALAKMLDMSARSVQIWFQNKRQSMRQTNRQSSSVASASHHPFSVANQNQVDPMVEDLVPHPSCDGSSGPMPELYLTGATHDVSSRAHASHPYSHSQNHYHQSSSHRHPRDQEELNDPRKWSRG